MVKRDREQMLIPENCVSATCIDFPSTYIMQQLCTFGYSSFRATKQIDKIKNQLCVLKRWGVKKGEEWERKDVDHKPNITSQAASAKTVQLKEDRHL